MTTTLTERSAGSLARPVARRMLRRSRRVWALTAVVIAAAVMAYVIVELVRFALGLAPWLIGPAALLSAVAGGGAVGVMVAVAAAVFGILCLWGAISPGRAGRRMAGTPRVPIVIDDAVVAGTLSRHVAVAAAVGAAQVTTDVARRRAAVDVQPSSGFAVDAAAAERAGTDTLGRLAVTPTLSTRIRVRESGVLA